MPRGSTKFNDDWKDQDDGSNNEKIGKWFSNVNKHKVKCYICNKTFSIENKGIIAIRRHAAGGIHKKKLVKAKENEDASRETIPIVEPPESWPSTSNDSIVLETSSSVNSSFNDHQSLDEQTRVSEAMWGALSADHNVSFNTSDHASKMFSKMFPDSRIAASFKCSRTKINYTIVDGIAVDVQEKLLESVKDVPFSILIDESNKQYGKKFLVILIKFYDQRYEDVTTRFLDICVCNKGTADVLVNVIVEFFNKHDLSF